MLLSCLWGCKIDPLPWLPLLVQTAEALCALEHGRPGMEENERKI